jgi:predicted nucleic acid-binding protein
MSATCRRITGMTRYGIDAVTLLATIDGGVPIAPEHQLVAPNSVRSEALELLLGSVDRGERSETEALAVHERMTELRIRLLGDRVSRRTAWRIARRNGWDTLRTAEYLAVTTLQADALVTIDPELAQAARAEHIAVAPIEALSTPLGNDLTADHS